MERQYTKRLVTSKGEAEASVWQQLPVIANHGVRGALATVVYEVSWTSCFGVP